MGQSELMKLRYLLGGLALILGLIRLNAAEPASHFADAGGLIASETNWVKSREAELTDYERKTGIKMLVQFHLKSPTDAEDAKPGAYMHALARQLGVDRHGVLIVYFHDDPDWRVWIGDELTNLFTGKPGTVAELTASEAIHNVKEAMLTAARAKAAAQIEHAEKAASEKTLLTGARRLAIQTDNLLEALKAKFAAK